MTAFSDIIIDVFVCIVKRQLMLAGKTGLGYTDNKGGRCRGTAPDPFDQTAAAR